MIAVLGRKVGMTQVFLDGTVQPVTVVYIPENRVVETLMISGDRKRIIIGSAFSKRIAVPQKKELVKRGIDSALSHRISLKGTGTVGEVISFDSLVAGSSVTVRATTKGKGFAGTIKRHGFHRGPETHGSDNVRRPGAIGAQQPQRVIKGKRMAGHMGSERRTITGLTIVDSLPEERLLLISGSIPGPKRGIVTLEIEKVHD